MALSSYMQNRLIELFFTGGDDDGVSPFKDKLQYLALYTDKYGTAPNETYVEVPTGATGYSRVNVNLPIEPAGVITNPTYVTNPTTINFPTAATSWGTIQYLGLTNDATSGSLIFVTPLTAPTAVNSGKIFRLNPHNLYFSLENHQWTGYWETVKPGGWSLDYSLRIIKWIMNIDMPADGKISPTTTYNVHIGRNVVYDAINRFVSWTECTGGGYNIPYIYSTDWSKSYYSGQAYNNKDLSWGPATSNWGTITDILFTEDDYWSGVPAFWAHLGGTGVTVNTGEGLTIPEGLVYVSFATSS